MELTDVSVRALLIFFKRSCKVARFLRTGKKKNLCPRRVWGSTDKETLLVHVNVIEQVILEGISRYMKDKNMTGSSEHEYRHGKSCFFTYLIPFCDEMAGLVDEGRWP